MLSACIPVSFDRPPPTMFVVVRDLDEEAAAIRDLGRFARAGPVAPVLDRDGLVKRIERCWRNAGLAYEIRLFAEARMAAPAPAGRSVLRRPDLILATPAFDARLRQLASALTGLRVANLAAASGMAGATAIVLAAPQDMDGGFVADLERLAARGTMLGVVPAEAGVDGRFALLKSLLATEVAWRRGAAIVASGYDADDAEGAPAAVLAGTGARKPKAPADVLLFCGHSNPWDAFGAADLVLCSRVSQGAANPANGLPCFAGAGCTRQRGLGRDVFSKEGLIAPEQLDAVLLVLEGCHVARLAGEPDDHLNGIVHSALGGDVLAVVASAELMLPAAGLDVLAIALLAEGRTIGEMLAEVNAARRRAFGATAAPQLGPSVLFGNPLLRFAGLRLHEAQATVVGRTAALALPDAAGANGRLARLQLDEPRGYAASVSEDIWVRGAILEDGRTYLWARSGAGVPMELRLHDADDPLHGARGRWRDMIVALGNWGPMLEMVRKRAEAEARSPPFPGLVEALPPTIDLLARTLAKPPPGSGLILNDTSWRELANEADAVCDRLSRALLAGAVEAVRTFGIGAVLELEGREEVNPAVGPVAACECGRGRIWRQDFTLGARLRVERRCEACAAFDVDDGRHRVTLAGTPLRWHTGGAVEVCLHCNAQDDAALSVVAATFVEPWPGSHDLVWPAAVEARLGPTATETLALPVNVPDGIVPGLHRLVALSVANGAFALHLRGLRIAVGAR